MEEWSFSLHKVAPTWFGVQYFTQQNPGAESQNVREVIVEWRPKSWEQIWWSQKRTGAKSCLVLHWNLNVRAVPQRYFFWVSLAEAIIWHYTLLKRESGSQKLGSLIFLLLREAVTKESILDATLSCQFIVKWYQGWIYTHTYIFFLMKNSFSTRFQPTYFPHKTVISDSPEWY